MATNVVMPQMGESIAEGTIVRWIKKVGDAVDRDEPMFEISTDKVDAEIPSPAAGVVTEIRYPEGETVAVNAVVAVIGQAGDVPVAAPAAMPAGQSSSAAAPSASTPSAPEPRTVAPALPSTSSAPRADSEPVESATRQRLSPVVRKIAKEHNIDTAQIQGTGLDGRVTRDDILAFVDEQQGKRGPDRQGRQPETPQPAAAASTGDRVEKMSVMRKRIAEHMVLSRRTSAHVHSVFEVNFSRVAQVREEKKAEHERAGAKLTFLSFILKAVTEAIHAMPVLNTSIEGDSVIYHKDINLGIAVALDWGLIVPVIKKADGKNLLGLSRAVADLANRARAKQLKPDEVNGGTFTVTNPGVFGALFGTPIINQPQVAILGVGNIEKRPVVINDAIAIRTMGYLTLGFDHRLIDGVVADQFMSHVKHTLENWDSSAA